MKKFLLAAFAICSATYLSAQVCFNYKLGGFESNQPITVGALIQFVSAPIVAADSCNHILASRSGQVYMYDKTNELKGIIEFGSSLTGEQKQRVINNTKPGYTFYFDRVKVGEENKLVQSVRLTIK